MDIFLLLLSSPFSLQMDFLSAVRSPQPLFCVTKQAQLFSSPPEGQDLSSLIILICRPPGQDECSSAWGSTSSPSWRARTLLGLGTRQHLLAGLGRTVTLRPSSSVSNAWPCILKSSPWVIAVQCSCPPIQHVLSRFICSPLFRHDH